MRATFFLALGTISVAADDISALVQSQVSRHSHRERLELEGLRNVFDTASDTFSQKLLETFARMPMPAKPSADTAGGVLIKRTGYTHEAGSSMTYHSTGGCKSEDDGGSNDCTLAWGDAVNISFGVHLQGGLRRGDKVSFTAAMRVQVANKSSPLATVFTGSALGTGGHCDICEGSCFMSTAAKDGEFVLDVTSPSTLTNATLCAGLNGDKTADLSLPPFTLNLVAPPDDLQLSGELLVSVEILDKTGQARVSQTIEHTVLAGKGAASAKLSARPLVPKTLAAALETSFRRVTPAMMAQGRKAETVRAHGKLAPGSRRGRKINAMVFKLKVDEMAAGSGHNITFATDMGCKSLDTQGSTDCKLEFGKPMSLNVGLHLMYTSEEGSYAIIKSTPKVGGMLGMMVGAMLKPVTMRVPLCGRGTVTVAAGMKPLDVDAGLCGFHAINLKAPAMPLLLPDISDMPLKFEGLPPVLPPTFGDLPPTTVEMDVQMFHADGSAIAKFTTTSGIGYA